MSEQVKKLIPKLRFPEFLDSDGWQLKQLGDVSNVVASGDLDTKLHSTERSEIFRYPVYSNAVENEGAYGYYKVGKYPRDSITITARGNLGYAFHRQTEFMGIGRLIVVSNLTGINASFLKECWNHLVEIPQEVTSIPQLTAVAAKAKLLPFPLQTEQQKIADCLSSLDELITAQNQKVETLKQHKKGLMQQLFPDEGETVPKLRFPEFENDGEWVEVELGSLTTKVGSGITPTGGDKNYKKSGRPFVRSQNVGWGELLLEDIVFIDEVTHESFISTEIKISDVLLNITGASIGRSAVADSRIANGNVNQHVCIIRVKQDVLNPTLLNQFLMSERGQSQIDSFQAGGNRQGLNFAQIRSFEIPLPPTSDEQQKIANFLSSIDELITTQTQQLEAYKTHKKGLMQQLFPSLDEVEA